MHDESADGSRSAGKVQRVIGQVRGRAPGPTLLVVAALHGNEPAGIEAAERVLARLGSLVVGLRGEVRFLVGNLAALAKDRRYIESDLNRMWLPERVDALANASEDRILGAEDRELRALWAAIRSALESAGRGAILIDLHTSSAHGCPFLTVGDTLRNRRFASNFPLPMILGLEEQIDGPLLEFLNNLGLVTIGVEAGQHRAPASVDHMESALWIGLVAAGMLDVAAVGDLELHRRRLARAAGDVPRVIEVRHRHPVLVGDGFRMEPGFENFRPVRRGQTLARDDEGTIEAPEDGLMLLPLYQGQGDDGFFLSREVSPFWLRVSELVRRLRVETLFRRLPGVRPHPRRPDGLVIDTRIARWFPLELYHLLGYRKLRRTENELIVIRREHDLARPRRYV
jgi:succinylglutamate desuccinylase